MDLERDVVEMEEIRLGLGMDLGTLSTAIGGDDGEPLPEGEHHSHRYGESPAPPYNTLEIGFRGARRTPSLDDHQSCRSVTNGIRIDVELSTSEIWSLACRFFLHNDVSTSLILHFFLHFLFYCPFFTIPFFYNVYDFWWYRSSISQARFGLFVFTLMFKLYYISTPLFPLH